MMYMYQTIYELSTKDDFAIDEQHIKNNASNVKPIMLTQRKLYCKPVY